MTVTEAQKLLLKALEAASDPLSHNDIHKALNDQLDDMHPGQCCVMDVYGDDESGDVVYHQADGQGGGQMYSAPYTLGTTNGKRTAEIDEESKKNVVPHTTYEEEADDDDSMVSQEAKRLTEGKLYKTVPTYERFISKSERNSADAGSFAGKGKSFPILKPGDVMAAVRSMGRAGSDNVGTGTLKKNIIAIAKKKGWTKYLPKAWQSGSSDDNDDSGSTKEALRNAKGELILVESAATLETIKLVEAKADYEIKLIAPGKGSSAFYPKEVLKRDGPNVFKAGTHVYLNHPTAAEEAARPEGDVKNLAGVLTTAAAYNESHAKGPGLYARMKVFADHGQMVEEKAQHVGMSIRASGIAESGRKQDGLPILKELTSAESVDVVTRAGAGGMILNESATGANGDEEIEMTATEVKRLVESGVQLGIRQATLPDRARKECTRLLEAVGLPPKAKERVIERVVESLDLSKELDITELGKTLAQEARAEGEYLAAITGSGRVVGMGLAPVEELKPKEAKRLKEAAKEQLREARDVFEELGMPKDAAKIAAKGRVA
jgi:hypothetical protein